MDQQLLDQRHNEGLVTLLENELAANDLVVLRRGGPPKLTPDGEWILTNFT